VGDDNLMWFTLDCDVDKISYWLELSGSDALDTLGVKKVDEDDEEGLHKYLEKKRFQMAQKIRLKRQVARFIRDNNIPLY